VGFQSLQVPIFAIYEINLGKRKMFHKERQIDEHLEFLLPVFEINISNICVCTLPYNKAFARLI
jgi:hypothetical protein